MQNINKHFRFDLTADRLVYNIREGSRLCPDTCEELGIEPCPDTWCEYLFHREADPFFESDEWDEELGKYYNYMFGGERNA